jgi:serine/threonine protein kinase/tetratricopeptide (TPR) repeat protein
MQPLACPDPRDLERLALGQLSEAEAERLGQHVLSCPHCAEFLKSLRAADHLVPPTAAESPGAPAPAETPPERVGRYRVVGHLGAGGMGVVYRAHDPQLERDVAIKLPVFHGSDESRTAARQRFLREARAAAAVRHPHVCPIYDVGEDQGRPYVVMALVEGETLGDRLRRLGRFEDVRAAVALVLQVADALAAVHAAHIIHRDLKPGNILLDRAGEPFLADFGLARGADSERLTAVGQLLGTPAYMAPEQAAIELGPVGPWSDQYSLGVVLYEMLTGRLPFEGSAAALLAQIGTKSVPPPAQYRQDLDTDLERLLLKALARRAQDRYGGVADFAAALRGWWEGPAAPPTRRKVDVRRRRLTMLQCGCDLFESEALLTTLDPEEQHTLLLQFQQLCRDVAAAFEGTAVKATDHGLLVCFGFPLVLESPARRAVRAGLDVLERMAGLNERLRRQHKDLRLSARVAVHSDLAVVTEPTGPGEALSVVGPVLSAVDQLERLTAPDTLTISDDVHELVQGYFECSDLGRQRLGPAGATAVYRVHRKLAASNRVEVAGPSGLTPLIGRDREVDLLQGLWDQAADGQGQVVLLVGEAGIGKSRLVHVLKEHIQDQTGAGRPATVIEWPCTPHTQNSSFFQAREHFERLLGLALSDSPEVRQAKLTAHLEELHLAGTEAVALLASLLGLALDGRYPTLGLSPLRQKEKTLDLLLDWLRAHAHRRPVLFVVEDLHWAGPFTLEFIDLVSGQTQGDHILTVLTCRPESRPPRKSRASQTQVSLNRLTRRQVGEMLAANTGLPRLPQDVVELVAERTDGVPLFVEEFAAMLQAGSVDVVGGTPQLADFFADHVIPATLHDLLLARLERAAGNFEVVQLAAAIGREFDYDLLQAVAPWDDEVLQRELAKLVDAGLLFVRGRPPDARYQFKHALIQDAAYQSMLTKKRQQFHLRIAAALEQRFPETCAAQPELLAHHCTEGGLVAKAVANWARAGEAARHRGAAVEASSHLRRGLELIGSLPETAQRHAQEMQLLVGLGVALQMSGGFTVPEAEAMFARAHDLWQKTGLTTQLFPVLYALFRYQPNYARGQELAEKLLRLAEQEANPGFVIMARRAVATTLFFQGKHSEALPHLETILAVAATPELRSLLRRFEVVDPWVATHSYCSWAHWLLGDPPRAAEQSRLALGTAEGLDDPFNVALALCFGASLQQFGRDKEGCRTTAARALALGTDKGFTVLAGWAQILHEWARADGGESGAGMTEISQGLAGLQPRGSVACRSYFLTLLAEACARAGRRQEGLTALAEAQEFADTTGERYWQAEVHRLRGELLLQHDPTALPDAEDSFHAALEVARRQQARSLELRAAVSLARVWDQQGRTQAAGELLAPVCAAFTEDLHTSDLQEARALLEHSRSGRR